MPAAIPDRFKLEMRLGRDGDIEEWLATDLSLDRPVLVRSLGPETSASRRKGFVESVSAAAKAGHPHLARVFAVEEVGGGAYSVSEWTGGSTARDRIEAGQPIELPDFLPNAAGLAGALAALHDRGVVHGDIDLSALAYSVSHAAKLGAFGRKPKTDMSGDVTALASTLESALTGESPGGPPPSESIDGFPRAVDRILRSGQAGIYNARQFEEALFAAPTLRVPSPEPRAASRKLLIFALILLVLAIGLVVLGRALSGSGQPIIQPGKTQVSNAPTTTLFDNAPFPAGAMAIENATSFDPFGGGGENDSTLSNLNDANLATFWSTERYESPLPEIKRGVGVTFSILGTPSRMQLIEFTPSTAFDLYWSDTFYAQLEQWSRVAGGRTPPGTTLIELPPRNDGFWLLWLTDLPLRSDGSYSSSISEVRFLP